MDKSVSRNIAFTSIIRINGRQYEFNFRRLPGPEQIYETDVTDSAGERIMFTMQAGSAGWRASGALLPAWIEQHSAVIGECIDRNVQ